MAEFTYNISHMAQSTTLHTVGVWVIGENLDTSAVLSVEHCDVVHIYVLDDIGLILILSERTN